MTKQTWKPGTMLSPLPPALISSGTLDKPNVMTAAWTGIICSDPVITYVSLRPSRYTHELVSQSKEFVINLPTWKMAEVVDMVGVKSGRDVNKFEMTGLTAEKSSKLNAPQIAECPVSVECKVLEVRSFGTHDMFLAEVVAVNVDDKYIDETGALELDKAGLLAYAHGFYYTLGRKIGKFGFSVEKKKKKSSVLRTETVLKADVKFSRGKKARQFVTFAENNFIENGVEVIVKKSRFAKAKKDVDTGHMNREHEGRFAQSGHERNADKFRRKTNKKTNYEGKSYRKKADGSFKKGLR